MAKVKDQLAQLGMGTLVAGMKAVESTLSKKQYKRLIATAVAQLLTMHPDYGAGKGAPAGKEDRGGQAVEEDAGEGGQGGREGDAGNCRCRRGEWGRAQGGEQGRPEAHRAGQRGRGRRRLIRNGAPPR